VQQVLADLRNSPLDGSGVFKNGKEEGTGGERRRGADVDLDRAAAVVEVAKFLIALGGRSAAISIHF